MGDGAAGLQGVTQARHCPQRQMSSVLGVADGGVHPGSSVCSLLHLENYSYYVAVSPAVLDAIGWVQGSAFPFIFLRRRPRRNPQKQTQKQLCRVSL